MVTVADNTLPLSTNQYCATSVLYIAVTLLTSIEGPRMGRVYAAYRKAESEGDGGRADC